MSLADGDYTITNRLYNVDLGTDRSTEDGTTGGQGTGAKSDVGTKSDVFIYKVASKGTDTSPSSVNWTLSTATSSNKIISTSITLPNSTTPTVFKTCECTKHTRAEAYTDKSTSWTLHPVTVTIVRTSKTNATVDGATVETITTVSTTDTFYTISNGNKHWKLTGDSAGAKISIEAAPTDPTADLSAFHFKFSKVS